MPNRCLVPGGALNHGAKRRSPSACWRIPRPKRFSRPRKASAVPDELQVQRFIQRIKKLVRRREQSHRAGFAFGHNRPMPHGQFPGLCVWFETEALRLAGGVHPGHAVPAYFLGRADQSRIVEDGTAVLLRTDDRFGMHQPPAGNKRLKRKIAAERTSREPIENHRCPIVFAHDSNPL